MYSISLNFSLAKILCENKEARITQGFEKVFVSDKFRKEKKMILPMFLSLRLTMFQLTGQEFKIFANSLKCKALLGIIWL